jgi:hypothetical protein
MTKGVLTRSTRGRKQTVFVDLRNYKTFIMDWKKNRVIEMKPEE